MVSRRNWLQSVERSSEPMPFDGGPSTRMQRKRDGQSQLVQLVKDGPQALRIVRVLRPVDGSQHVLVRLRAKARDNLLSSCLVGQHAERRRDDRAAG